MTRARLGALAVGAAMVAVPVVAAAQDLPYQRAALIIVVPGLSFEEMMGLPEVAALARAGGAGVLANAHDLDIPRVPGVPEGTPPGRESFVLLDRDAPDLGQNIRDTVSSFPAEALLVLILSQDPSSEMLAEGDELQPIVMAVGQPSGLFPDHGEQGALTSDSTRRSGVVTAADVRATDVAYLGGRAEEFDGEPIRVVEGLPPFELHERYLAQRRMYVPVGIATGSYVALVGLLGIACVVLGARLPWSLRRVVGWGCLTVAALATALLAAGHLPDLSYATVVPFVALVTVLGTLAFAPLETRDVLLVPVGIGIAVLAYFLLEAILAWTAALTPFVGGSELDGGRFYGLPNAFVGLLIGSSLWIAQRLRTGAGFALIVAVGLFAGLPFAGANLGGAVSLFAAAGLWLAVRERERLGVWKGIGAVAGVTLLGTAVVLVSHAISPIETHVTRFEEQVGGVAAVFERFGDRLQVGFELIARNPFALIPVIGLPVAIAAVLRPPAGLRPDLEGSPAWRDAILVTLLAGVVAYVANDSGPAAAGLTFGLGLGGLLGVSVLSGARKIGEP